MLKTLARLRVPLGFVFAALAFYLAHPTRTSMMVGFGVALVGEALRVWAAGHIEKGREITRSGPYRFVRHPLYLGSAVMSVGFMVAAQSVTVAILVSAYIVITYVAAIRTEEATLDSRFDGEYSAYRAGRADPVTRPFSLARVMANREYRSVIGLVAGMAILYWRSRM
jgi:protein-S-isoprenylcysteine O-methyltransferase Ste14